MACGCPVVISDKVGIYHDVEIHQAGIIVQTTSDSVAEGMKKLLYDEKLRQNIVANALNLVKKNII